MALHASLNSKACSLDCCFLYCYFILLLLYLLYIDLEGVIMQCFDMYCLITPPVPNMSLMTVV